MGDTLNCLRIVATGVEMSGSPFLNWYNQSYTCCMPASAPASMVHEKKNSEHPAEFGLLKACLPIMHPHGIEPTFIDYRAVTKWQMMVEERTAPAPTIISTCLLKSCDASEGLWADRPLSAPRWARASTPFFFPLPCIMPLPIRQCIRPTC